jgi:hypothetical protein
MPRRCAQHAVCNNNANTFFSLKTKGIAGKQARSAKNLTGLRAKRGHQATFWGSRRAPKRSAIFVIGAVLAHVSTGPALTSNKQTAMLLPDRGIFSPQHPQ